MTVLLLIDWFLFYLWASIVGASWTNTIMGFVYPLVISLVYGFLDMYYCGKGPLKEFIFAKVFCRWVLMTAFVLTPIVQFLLCIGVGSGISSADEITIKLCFFYGIGFGIGTFLLCYIGGSLMAWNHGTLWFFQHDRDMFTTTSMLNWDEPDKYWQQKLREMRFTFGDW